MDHYFTNNPNIKSNILEKKVTIKNKEFVFLTDHGVFSKKGLDFGTRTLLETLPELEGKVLDFGCGYGPVGIYIQKTNNIEVDMIDINNRSLELAQKNAELNKTKVNIFQSDTYQNVKEKYDYIITNPPIRVGKNKLYEILREAKTHLKSNGQLWFVIHKDQGAKTVMKDLNEIYQITLIEKNKGFYIIRAVNN